jgi:hypothetical protein
LAESAVAKIANRIRVFDEALAKDEAIDWDKYISIVNIMRIANTSLAINIDSAVKHHFYTPEHEEPDILADIERIKRNYAMIDVEADKQVIEPLEDE